LKRSLRRRGRTSRWRLGLAGLLSAGLIASPVIAQNDQDAAADAAVAQIEAPPRASGGANAITQTVVAAGVLACASRVDQVARYLMPGPPGNFTLFLPSKDRDQYLVSTSLEVGVKEMPPAYASADFAPGMVNGCGAVYEIVVFWPQKCAEVATRQFGGLRKGPNLGKFILSLDTGAGARVFLMPAGNAGCVSIKKELL
jgi:hypothetical protein